MILTICRFSQVRNGGQKHGFEPENDRRDKIWLRDHIASAELIRTHTYIPDKLWPETAQNGLNPILNLKNRKVEKSKKNSLLKKSRKIFEKKFDSNLKRLEIMLKFSLQWREVAENTRFPYIYRIYTKRAPV